MQKTYTADFLTKRQAENNGDLEQYFIKDNHPAIIPRDEWEAVQLELIRREEFRQRHGIHTVGSSTGDRFCSRVFCAACGGKFIRRYWKGIREVFWKCENAEKKRDTVGGKVILPPHGKEFFHATVSRFLHPAVSTFFHNTVTIFLHRPVSTFFNGR